MPRSRAIPHSLRACPGCGLTNAFRITKDNAARLDRVSYLIDQELKASGKLRLCASSGHNYLHPSGAVWQQRLGKLITNRLIDMTVVLKIAFFFLRDDTRPWQMKLAITIGRKKSTRNF